MRNFKDYTGIIKGLAYQFSPTLKEDFEDLVQEGCILFLMLEEDEYIYGLDSNFESALYTTIRQNFLNKVKGKSYQKRAAEITPFHEVEYLLGHNPVKNLDEYLSLSKELKEVVDSILNCPEELKSMVKELGFRGGFKKYLIKIKGWSRPNAEEFFNEFAKDIVF